jgi:hypothetical protein
MLVKKVTVERKQWGDELWGVAINPWNHQLVLSSPSLKRLLLYDYAISGPRFTLQLESYLGGDDKIQKSPSFASPKGLCFQPYTRHLLVCDETKHHLQVLSNPAASMCSVALFGVKTDSTNKYVPVAVSCDASGSVWTVDSHVWAIDSLVWAVDSQPAQSCLIHMDPSGRFLKSLNMRTPMDVQQLNRHHAPSSCTSALVVVGEGENRAFSLWSADGRYEQVDRVQVSQEGAVRSVCVDMTGFIYVACNDGRIRVYDPRNVCLMLQEIGEGCDFNFFSGVRAMCVDEDNTLVVVDGGTRRLLFFK